MAARRVTLFVAACLSTVPGCNQATNPTKPHETGTSATGAQTPKADKRGLEDLQGTWLIVGYGAKGDPVEISSPDEDEPWVIRSNKLTHFDNVRRDDIKLAADLKVDPTKNPAHIDFAIKGKWKGKDMEWTTCGIYALKGDELTICVPEKFDPWEPENRPTEFKSTEPPPDKGSGFSVYVLKRKK
jgi:uncharacterized protein (TIGR03067 family)